MVTPIMPRCDARAFSRSVCGKMTCQPIGETGHIDLRRLMLHQVVVVLAPTVSHGRRWAQSNPKKFCPASGSATPQEKDVRAFSSREWNFRYGLKRSISVLSNTLPTSSYIDRLNKLNVRKFDSCVESLGIFHSYCNQITHKLLS